MPSSPFKSSINYQIKLNIDIFQHSARLYLSRADLSSSPEIVRAQVGERLQLNCAAANSHPAAKITWYSVQNTTKMPQITPKNNDEKKVVEISQQKSRHQLQRFPSTARAHISYTFVIWLLCGFSLSGTGKFKGSRIQNVSERGSR